MYVMSRDVSAQWNTFRLAVREHMVETVVFVSGVLDWASDHLGQSRFDFAST
jgi:hypothetical protein